MVEPDGQEVGVVQPAPAEARITPGLEPGLEPCEIPERVCKDPFPSRHLFPVGNRRAVQPVQPRQEAGKKFGEQAFIMERSLRRKGEGVGLPQDLPEKPEGPRHAHQDRKTLVEFPLSPDIERGMGHLMEKGLGQVHGSAFYQVQGQRIPEPAQRAEGVGPAHECVQTFFLQPVFFLSGPVPVEKTQVRHTAHHREPPGDGTQAVPGCGGDHVERTPGRRHVDGLVAVGLPESQVLFPERLDPAHQAKTVSFLRPEALLPKGRFQGNRVVEQAEFAGNRVQQVGQPAPGTQKKDGYRRPGEHRPPFPCRDPQLPSLPQGAVFSGSECRYSVFFTSTRVPGISSKLRSSRSQARPRLTAISMSPELPIMASGSPARTSA